MCQVCACADKEATAVGAGEVTMTPQSDAQSGMTQLAIEAAAAVKPIYDEQQLIGALFERDGNSRAWDQNAIFYQLDPAGLQLAFDFIDEGEAQSVPLSADQITQAREAFELWDDLIAVDLIEFDGSDTTIELNPNITFSSYEGSQPLYSFSASWWDFNAGERGRNELTEVQVWIDGLSPANNDAADFEIGGRAAALYLHEIGHALGLSHPGAYNSIEGGGFSYANNAEYAQDSDLYTVMSYFSAREAQPGIDRYDENGDFVRPQTPMLHDILAVQAVYGADMETRATDTTYGFNATADRDVYDFSVNSAPIISIWDGGGYDVIDLSGYGVEQYLTLVPGEFSNVGYLEQNLSIAYGAEIEGAVGGEGDDELIGNDLDNYIEARGGDDALYGGLGDDTLLGEAGDDVIEGGEGDDALDGGLGADALRGENGDDLLFGGKDDDVLEGGAGDDRLFGGDQDDILRGGDGADLLVGGAGDDALSGGAGNDTLQGTTGQDTLSGGDDMDRLDGSAGDDLIDGNGGADLFIGAQGNDTLLGGSEDVAMDAYFASHNAREGIVADLSNNTLNDEFGGYDLVFDIERIAGTSFDDMISGSSKDEFFQGLDGADLLVGLGGEDRLFGGAGDDTIEGGAGNDQLEGGAGGDHFIFLAPGFGVDSLIGFEGGMDVIEISDPIATDFSDLEISQIGEDVQIAVNSDRIILLNQNADYITADDFVFV